MKTLILVLLGLISSSVYAHDVTVYLIRHAHAEQGDVKNPKLTELGQKQAAHWAKILNDVKFNAIYSSDYIRTQDTAKPIAVAKNLKVQSYDPKNLETNKLINQHNNEKVLVVGHSNTTPDNVNKFLGEKRFEWIDHHDHGYLFIVKVFGKSVSVEKIKVFE